VWLNGVHVYHQNSGYVSFQFYIHNVTGTDGKSPALLYGADNVLVVRADALTAQEGWFYEGGGITRHVWLNSADPLFLVPWSPFFPSAVTGAITSGPLGNMGPQTAASAVVLGQADVYNSRPGLQVFELKFSVFDASGAPVASSTVHANLTQGGWRRFYSQIALPGPVSLWNTEAPYLYTVNTTISVGGSTVDDVAVSIGVRDAFWSPNTGFTLNGIKLPAQGFSNHQDFGGCGTAVPDRINEFRVTSLRALGSNFWRTAHNPVNPEVLDYCDAHGMLVWLENRFINPGVQPISGPQDPPLPPTVAVADPGLLKDAQDMVIRARNHPSVVIYSLCNEGGCEIGRTFGGVIGAQFKDVISQADTSRPLTANSEWGVGSADTLTNIVDVMTCSYSYSTYTSYHLTHPWKPIMGGESASCTSDRGFYGPSNKTEGVVNANDFGCVASSVASYAVNAWDSGNFGWTGHDVSFNAKLLRTKTAPKPQIPTPTTHHPNPNHAVQGGAHPRQLALHQQPLWGARHGGLRKGLGGLLPRVVARGRCRQRLCFAPRLDSPRARGSQHSPLCLHRRALCRGHRQRRVPGARQRVRVRLRRVAAGALCARLVRGARLRRLRHRGGGRDHCHRGRAHGAATASGNDWRPSLGRRRR
jgi:beta-galactosidase